MTTSNASSFWREHLQIIERDGCSIAAYAREHALSAQSLYGWRNKLRSDQPTKETRVRLAEVVTTHSPYSSGVLVRVAGATLEFDRLPDASWLAELLQGIEAAR